jgi:RNA-binding protein YhbY
MIKLPIITIDVSDVSDEYIEDMARFYNKSINELAGECVIHYRDDKVRKMNFHSDLKPLNPKKEKNIKSSQEEYKIEININGKTLREDLIESMTNVLNIKREQADSLVTDEFLERLTKDLYSLRCEYLASLSLLINE